ncbi:hypothetical protein GEMRC1_000414 [Eukaryota sp. GEM-RC1]
MYHITVPSNSVNIVSQLFLNKQKEFLTDKFIVFHGQSYPCHSSFLSSFSSVFKEKLLSSDHEVNFPELQSIVPDADLFFQILDYCYGQPLELTFDNMANVLSICSVLDLSSLKDSIHNVMSERSSKPRCLQLKSEEVLHTIQSSVQRDVMLSYTTKSLTISSLVLICSSEYFKNLFCFNLSGSDGRIFSYNGEIYRVSHSNFESFFNFFLGESISLNINNVVDFYQLSEFFGVNNLKEACNSFVSSLTSTRDILSLLKTISERNFVNMLQDNKKIFGKLLKDVPSHFPLPLSFISLLIEVVSNSWLLECLTLSITSEVFEENDHTLSQIFEKIIVNDQNINEIYTYLRPFFDEDHLCQFLLPFSMKIFQGVHNVRIIPDDWFLWCLSQSCLNHERNKPDIDFLDKHFSTVIDSKYLSEIYDDDDESFDPFYPYLTPRFFKKLKNTLPRSYDLFLIRCFVKTWEDTDLWTATNFEKEILNVNFQSNTHSMQILNSLSELKNDSQLDPFLPAFLSKQTSWIVSQHLRSRSGISAKGYKPRAKSANAYDFHDERYKAEEDPLIDTLKVVTGLLNKLSQSNKVKIFSSVTDIFKRQHPCSLLLSESQLEEFWSKFVSLLFDKAVMEPVFVNLYSELCTFISKLFPGFSSSLVAQCQTNFEKFFIADTDVSTEIDDIIQQLKRNRFVDGKEMTEVQVEKQKTFRENKLKAKVLGNVEFVASLILHSVIPPGVASSITRQLVEKFQQPMAIQGLVTLWTKLLESAGINDYIENVVAKHIRDFSWSWDIPVKERCLCANWMVYFNEKQRMQDQMIKQLKS